MSIDFSKYQKTIANFRGEANKPNFDIQFTQSTKNLAKSEQFLLKMELKRLASACTRSIDLRGLVDGDCKLFQYSAQSHFLDDIAIDVFEESIEAYKGYTFGVYDAVTNTENNFRVIYQKEKKQVQEPILTEKPAVSSKKIADKTQYPVSIFPLDTYHYRTEERMNFVTSLVVVFEDQKQRSVSSIDVSVAGLKFRFNSKMHLSVGQKITITFKGLEDDFKLDNSENLVYLIKNIHRSENTQLVGCQRVDADNKDALMTFLSSYIYGHKRRYKINLDNTISALHSRSLEQFVLPTINELPIYFEQTEQGVLPRYALTTNNNQSLFQYWQDEESDSNLHYLVNESRLERLLNQHKQGKPLLVFSFIHHHQGKDFFYTLDEMQLPQGHDAITTFLSFAAKKSSFMITQLSYFELDKSKTYSPFTLPNTQELEKQYVNLPPSTKATKCLDSLSFCVVASDITHNASIEQYQKLSRDGIDSSTLKVFGHKRSKEKLTVEAFGASYKNHRVEHRFIYNAPILVEFQNIQWQGTIMDFSISGLKIELESSAELNAGDIVHVSFPSLQKITTSYDLSKLPYEVVYLNKKQTIINLRIYVKGYQHVGRSFFKLLINKNKEKLTVDESIMAVPGLGAALRTQYAQNMRVPTLIVQTSGSRYKVETLVSNDNNNAFLQQLNGLSDRKSYYNFYPLLTRLYKDNYLELCLKKLLTNTAPIHCVLYIGITTEPEQIDRDVSVRVDSELNTPELREFFIKSALKKGDFFAFQLKISRTHKPNIEYLNTELSYISTYAIHRGKQIEQEISSVVAAIQYTDITHEVLFSHGL